ncbi:hypothetical protein ZHAS_00012365 [Anopheles sinensis]|uniref:Uncharacterized protein n=1 Tax=Anopheles sinensis TaxID=74873 RepID=A0A084W2N7_ANOSI|nr:hypothetical protein ZHAS_00012365 [Anopheles sinensis]
MANQAGIQSQEVEPFNIGDPENSHVDEKDSPHTGKKQTDNGKEETDTGKVETDTNAVDVSSIAGLITIVTVNFHQLESLLQVGPELGPKFWINIVLVSISIFCAVSVL